MNKIVDQLGKRFNKLPKTMKVRGYIGNRSNLRRYVPSESSAFVT